MKRRKLINLPFCLVNAASSMLLIAVLSINGIGLYAQNDTSFELSQSYNFPKATENKIVDKDNTLVPLWNRLNELRNKPADSTFVVSIIHLGDSHIQADVKTNVLRTSFQAHFGNAGRGLIAPLKLAKTNEPLNYKIFSPQEWKAFRCIKPGEIPFGIAGLVIENTDDSLANVFVQSQSFFDKVIIYYDADKTAAELTDSSLLKESNLIPYGEEFTLTEPQEQVGFTFTSSTQEGIRLYGMDLRNRASGVLYHAIGINGAHYADYTGNTLFAQQIAVLAPDLFIISMGTNEAYGPNFSSDVFYDEIDQLIQSLKKQSPNAIFLLTTPAEAWKKTIVIVKKKKRRKMVPNATIEAVRNTIVKYAADHQIAYWDLFTITGGKGSAHAWSNNHLFAKDGVHFTKGGYEYQGELLFQALYNSFTSFIAETEK